jgi:Mg2+ and Co2+ transporter CorA
VAVHWTDLVDPGREEILAAVPVELDADAIELLAGSAGDGRSRRPLLEGHRGYVLAVLSHPVTRTDVEPGVDYLELDVVVTPSTVLTVRKRGPSGGLVPVDGIASRVDDEPCGGVFHGVLDDTADAFLDVLDGLFEAIDDLESEVESMSGPHVRRRIALLRNELLLARRASSATRGIARRVVDGRVDVGRSELFPPEIEAGFVDTYETLVRVTEELDVARDLLGGVRDFYQAKIAEQQNEVGKKLTVIASLVLVPSLIVGFYGQNFAGQFREWYWSVGVSLTLIVVTTIVQLALFRWRRWL